MEPAAELPGLAGVESGGRAGEGSGWQAKDSCPGGSHWPPHPLSSDWGVVLSFPKGVGEAAMWRRSFLFSLLLPLHNPPPPPNNTHTFKGGGSVVSGLLVGSRWIV